MDDYETLSKIGDGTFGTVYLCRRNIGPEKSETSQRNTDLVAVKKMKKCYHNWDECIQLREVKVLKRLNHRNIILLKEVIREDNHLYLVFEHMDENLYQLIGRQLVPFPEWKIRKIVSQIISGLAYLHKHDFFHRDIKPENILCRNDAESIKIADFGLTREISSQPPYTDYVSTRWYRAPELLVHSSNYSWMVDIWAVGCITGELYTLRPLFPGRSEIDQIYKISQVLGAPNMNVWPEGERLTSLKQIKFPKLVPLDLSESISGCSQAGLKIIRRILHWVPSERPTAKELLSDEYFSDQTQVCQ